MMVLHFIYLPIMKFSAAVLAQDKFTVIGRADPELSTTTKRQKPTSYNAHQWHYEYYYLGTRQRTGSHWEFISHSKRTSRLSPTWKRIAKKGHESCKVKAVSSHQLWWLWILRFGPKLTSSVHVPCSFQGFAI